MKSSDEPDFGKAIDLEMLVMTRSGRERTESDLRRLLHRCDLRLNRILPLPTGNSIMEAVVALSRTAVPGGLRRHALKRVFVGGVELQNPVVFLNGQSRPLSIAGIWRRIAHSVVSQSQVEVPDRRTRFKRDDVIRVLDRHIEGAFFISRDTKI